MPHPLTFKLNPFSNIILLKQKTVCLIIAAHTFHHTEKLTYPIWFGRWTFFPPEDLPLLYPLFPDSTDAVFQVDLSQPDLSLHPLLSLSHPTQVTLSPGELLFVPAGSPHRVENLEPSLAISANFVDSSNLDEVVRELRVNGLRDPRAQALLEAIEDPEFRREMDYGQNDLPWNEFKTWPR